MRSFEPFKMDDILLDEIKKEIENGSAYSCTYSHQHADAYNTLSTTYKFQPDGVYEVSVLRTYEVDGNTIKIGVDEWNYRKQHKNDELILRYVAYPEVKMYLKPLNEESAN